MFEIATCEDPRVLLIRFREQIGAYDFAKLDSITQELRQRGLYDSIIDMRDMDVDKFEKPHAAPGFVAGRGAMPEPFAGKERIYVAPDHDLKLMVRLFSVYQEAHGWRPPSVVHTLEEALHRLGVTLADFRPL